MSEVKKIVTPIGWLEVEISVDEEIGIKRLGLTASSVIVSPESERPQRHALNIGKSQVITLKPGKYSVRGVLGKIRSESIELEILPGETERVNFHFGVKTT